MRTLIVFGLVCLTSVAAMGQVPIPAADVLIVADESGSMTQAHFDWLADLITGLEADYASAKVGVEPGYPNRYRLVGFGNDDPGHGAGAFLAHFHGGWMNATDMAAFVPTALALDAPQPGGHLEDGYEAMELALTAGFRDGSYRAIILITDEDRDDVDSVTREQICLLLEAAKATPNSIVTASNSDPSFADLLGVDWDGTAYLADGSGDGYMTVPGGSFDTFDGDTKADYVELSWDLCGATWDIDQTQTANEDNLINAYGDVKVEELKPRVRTVGAVTCADKMLAIAYLESDGGQICTFWFEYRDQGSAVWKKSPKWFGGQTGWISVEITGLTPETWYQIRAVVENAVFKTTSDELMFVATRAEGAVCPENWGSGNINTTLDIREDCGCDL